MWFVLLCAILFVGMWYITRDHQGVQNTAPTEVPAQPVKITPSKIIGISEGETSYTCANGSKIFVITEEDQVEMKLVYPDEAYGVAIFEKTGAATSPVILDDGEHRLQYDNDSATFAINDVDIAGTCVAIAMK